MTIPVIIAPPAAELAVPYLTPGAFAAFPDWLDLDNLIPGGAASLQTAELAEVLLAASAWCVEQCDGMRLDAHWVQGEATRTRASGAGRITLRPRDIPMRAITSFFFGADPGSLAQLSLPDPTMWVEDGREVSFRPGGIGGAFTGPVLQFGSVPSPRWPAYVSWSYIAGYPSTTFAATVSAPAASVTVTDPTGILPGDVLRVYDEGISEAGANEALTVAAAYTPAMPVFPPVPAVIPLAAPAAYPHTAGTLITGMPRGILQAVICYAIALLTREDVSAEEPSEGFGPAARTVSSGSGGQAGGLINDALGFLARHKPVLRS